MFQSLSYRWLASTAGKCNTKFEGSSVSFVHRVSWTHQANFEDIWLKIYRLPNFNMLFQVALTKVFKSTPFSFFMFTESWSRDQLTQKASFWFSNGAYLWASLQGFLICFCLFFFLVEADNAVHICHLFMK